MTARAAVAADAHLPNPFGWRFTGPLMMGSTLNPINSSMIATALVGVGTDFHRGPQSTAILISVLYLCSAIMQPTMGKLARVFGDRRVFVGGLLVLVAAGVIGACAPAFGFLVLSRALIGIGTSAAYPTAMSMVRKRADAIGTGVPSRVLGGFSIAAQVIAVVGLPVGGVLTGVLGWRAVFFVNIPVAVLTLVWVMRSVPADPPIEHSGPLALLRTIDVVGIVLFACTIAGALVILGDLSNPIWWLIPTVVFAFVALVGWERRTRSPLIDVRMLARNRPLVRTYLRQALAALGSYTAMYGISQWMEDAAGYSAARVGVILIPLSAASVVVARVNSTHGWVRRPLTLTGICFASSGVLTLVIDHSASVYLLIAMSVLFGLANGLSGFANQATLYTQSAADEIGVASGLYRTFAYMGAIASSSLIGIAFGAHATDVGLHVVGVVIVVIGVVLTAMTVLDRRIPREVR
ncbi:MFS transporter [Gordonia sp. CPCC 206044]|uniref:MFS transporter n=1 Tax=Gordonia sp. CPCC 206044 TaxID=3140793 RepID=UPI003AF3DEC8